jgi:hypothetical protein
MHPDPILYDYWPYAGWPKIVWPNGNPGIVGYSQRAWGNTIGHWRLMDLLDKYDLRGSISLSIGLIDHHPEIIAAVADRNWEFFSHGIYNTRFSFGMSAAQERAVLTDVFAYSVMNYTPAHYTDILIRHFDQLLGEGETSGTEIAAFYREHYWETALADIAARGVAPKGTGFAP